MKLEGRLRELQVPALELYLAENDVEKVLLFLRGKELFLMDSAKILSVILDKPLEESLPLGLRSSTWEDKREGIERFQNAFFYGVVDPEDDEL
jgi:hypothetical protein